MVHIPVGDWHPGRGDNPTHMGVSKYRGTPKSSHFNRVFHYKPSILGNNSPSRRAALVPIPTTRARDQVRGDFRWKLVCLKHGTHVIIKNLKIYWWFENRKINNTSNICAVPEIYSKCFFLLNRSRKFQTWCFKSKESNLPSSHPVFFGMEVRWISHWSACESPTSSRRTPKKKESSNWFAGKMGGGLRVSRFSVNV